MTKASGPQRCGTPTIKEYNAIVSSELFLNMESFSNCFCSANSAVIKNYPWAPDPLHQWSRQWEYPFVYSQIEQALLATTLSQSSSCRILDAGSGFTFFPHYLQSAYPTSKVYCCDSDGSLEKLFKAAKDVPKLAFNRCDLCCLDYPDDFFNIIYCISVLEHLENYEGDVLNQFSRVLKSNGYLILTFDISIDGKAEISLEKCRKLLDKIDFKFLTSINLSSEEILSQDIRKDILTTNYAAKTNRKLLPSDRNWKNLLLQIAKLQNPWASMSKLTVFCNSWKKP